MSVHSLALVGTVGGAGTTRLAVELGTILARDDRDVLVLDLDFDTQGLAGRIDGRLDPDSTRLLSNPDTALVDAVYGAGLSTAGRLDYCPAHAPFTRVAEAKTPDAAGRLADRLAEAGDHGYDAVLIDTPPVASNPAIAAVTDADRTVLVATPDERGVDAIQRARGRLDDVCTTTDHVLATRAAPGLVESPDDVPDADVVLPDVKSPGATAGPDAIGDNEYAATVADAAETLFETDLGLTFESGSRLDAIRAALS